MSPLTRLLIVLFIFEFSHLHADPTRNQILQARFSWSNMWDLANDIESLSDSGELDSQLKNKLLNILTWKRSSIFISQNIHIRKVKRAATDILLTQNAPSSSEVLLLSRSLDRATSTPRYEGNLDSSDYIYIAEVLVEWAYRGDPTASSELIRAIESNSATKVFEIEFALAQKNALDPNWLSNNPEFLSRIKRALGRPWVFELLKHYYEKELRFSQHAEKQFYLNHERPLSGQLKPEDLEIHLSIEDNSLFHFLLTLEALNQNPSLLVDRNRSSQLIAEAIEHVLKTHPNLRSNIFFATFALQSIEVFALHSPYIDHLVASWININFAPHSEIAQIPNGYEKALVKNIRNNAFNHLLRIQQRFQFSERLAKLSLLSAEAKRNMGFEFLPIEHPNSTALDRLALLSALNSKNVLNRKKIEMIDSSMTDDPAIQDILLKLLNDPEVQILVLEKLDTARELSPKRVSALAAIIGISTQEEATLYLARHSNLRAKFSKLPTSNGAMDACRMRIRKWLGY